MSRMIDSKKIVRGITNAMGENVACVGLNGCISIEIYGEPGDGAHKPAFEVVSSHGAVMSRGIIGGGFTIHYVLNF